VSETGPVGSPEIKAAFRNAMRRLAATVTIITTTDGTQPHGMTATAVTSVSTDPPTLLVCVNQTASMHDPLHGSGRFCVNLLRSAQTELCGVFSGQRDGAERFNFGEWMTDESGVPYLADAQASLLCTVDLKIPYATHTIFIGRVDQVRIFDEVQPLIYQDGRFANSVPLVPAE
jgi:flavin reductase (DIM6/NTAB) family NADH-FMN oxidoreductase RutF